MLTTVVASLLLAYALPTSAKLADELSDMFSNVTAPGSFNTTLRQGWAGGGVGVRAPIRNITIVSFDPPRLSAGCGGIDFFGGSFSFINSDQLVALLRAIAANAIGVAFKAAIDAINPQLGKIMGDFQQIIQNLNQGLSNTCALASTIVKNTASYMGLNDVTKSAVTGEQTAAGRVIDTMANFTGGLASASNSWFTGSAGLSEKAAGNNDMRDVGNLVWKALGTSGIANNIGNPITGEVDQKAGKEFIMTLLGTLVTGGADQGKTNAAQGNSKGAEAPPSTGRYAATMSMRMMRDGPSDEQSQKIELLKCAETSRASGGTVPDGACNDVRVVVGPSDFAGIVGYVNRLMFGNPGGMSYGVTATSIIGKIQTCDDASAQCGFTAEQQKFLQSIRGPALGLLMKVQHSQVAMAQVADIVVPIVANRLSMSYASMVLMTANRTFDGKNQEPMPDFVQAKIVEIREFLAAADKEDKEMWDRYEKVQAFVNNIIQNEAAFYVPTAGN